MDTKKWWNVFLMVGSMMLFFVVFCLFLSWEKALIISGSLFFHEYGHVFAMQRYGMKVKGMYFIPFVGGAAVPASRMPSHESDVVISLAGPVFGLILAFATVIAYVATGSSTLGAAVVLMAWLNLFNLLPVFPLDGGRVLSCIAHSVDPRIGIILMAGSVILIGWLLWFTGNLFIIIIVAFAFMAMMDYRDGRPIRQRKLNGLEDIQRCMEAGGYGNTVSRACLGMELNVPGWEEGIFTKDAIFPSVESLRERLSKAIEQLREHPPLPRHCIVIATWVWMGIVGLFLGLAALIVLDPAVLQEWQTFF